jgi:hypothetical protein
MTKTGFIGVVPAVYERRQGCIRRWVGPRAVPARSAQEHARRLGKPERPGAVGAAASRDGSRSDELDAATLRVDLRNHCYGLFSY